MRAPASLVRLCRLVVENAARDGEQVDDGDVEYWSRVETVLEDGREVPTVKMVLRVMEICPDCKFFRSVFVVSPNGATCESCFEAKNKTQESSL